MKIRLRWMLIPLALMLIIGVVIKNTEKAAEIESLKNEEEEPVEKEEEIQLDENSPCIVVDAGHGGYDPGMVNANGVIEKEINLQIALALKTAFEKEGFRVVLTRDSDDGLYEEGTSGRKMQDLKNRCQIIGDAQPVCTISIHQNSFPDESIYGPQVFYYHTSEGSKELAEVIQKCLNEQLLIEKPREAKDNGSYYILKRSPSVIALVECGFLSNEKEAGLLVTEEYQKQIAEAICLGVMNYLTEQEEQSVQKQN